ncbi:autotransporter domain-containing protein [Ketobacter sp.]|uniref:autotransporter domain-containing protein n=1 Tax=Ketobacter sp. TaxID=2083498 RepID=UPI000F24052F|nr:autotransporter domain-containing protein [Ketobacter sp.]RLT97481.1 MAG: hypothetical protein D9N14_11815 [Ketobacter sp.]
MPLTGVGDIADDLLQRRTNAVLAVMGYSVVPDVTTSTLSITNTESGDPQMTMSQLAGGFTISRDVPLYLEGGVAYSRYDPTFAYTDGAETRDIPLKWTSFMVTAGVGWDFRIRKNLVIRPIADFAYGHLESDVSIAGRYLDYVKDKEFEFLDGGKLDAAGYGGSIMLDYEDYQPARDIDIEWRYNYVVLENYQSTGDFVDGKSDAISTNLYMRWRVPSRWQLLGRPFRYVYEGAHSTFFGDQVEVIGFDHLTSLGLGGELDTSAYDIIVSRVRLVLRYRFGDNVRGHAVGLAASF